MELVHVDGHLLLGDKRRRERKSSVELVRREMERLSSNVLLRRTMLCCCLGGIECHNIHVDGMCVKPFRFFLSFRPALVIGDDRKPTAGRVNQSASSAKKKSLRPCIYTLLPFTYMYRLFSSLSNI